MTRMRSPNYPAISLSQAIDLVGKLHSKNRANAVDRETAAKDLGYSGLTGRTLKLIGALAQYDLIEKSGKGNVKVSKTAVDILHGLDEETKRHALHEAGNAPALFQRIFARFEDGIPSDNAIKSYLIQEGFTDAAIGPVLKSFMDTTQYLAQSDASESYGEDEESEQESGSTQPRAQESRPMQTQIDRSHAPATPSRANDGPLHFNYSMDGVITVTGTTRSPSELQAFLDKLAALKVLLTPDPKDDDAG